MRKLFVVLGAIVAVAAFAPLGSAARSAAVPKPASFTDPSGDANGAPDVTGATASVDSNGAISVDVQIAGGLATANPNEDIFLFLDTDRNPSTGSSGAEYAFDDTPGTGYAFARWDGSNFVDATPGPTVAVTRSATGIRFTFAASDIGGAAAFGFDIATLLGDPANKQFDAAPDQGEWSYDTTPPTVTGATFILTPAAATASKGVKAGTKISVTGVSLKLSNNDTASPDSFSCTATLAGKRLASSGHCTWRVPKKAHGTMVVTVTISYGGVSSVFRTTIPVHKR
jgi:hypothetical protein